MSRRVLIIEIDESTSSDELSALMPDAQVWGEIDPVEAALMVLDLATV